METTHTIESLRDFVKELNKKTLKPLIEELEQEPSPLSVYLKLTEAQWELKLIFLPFSVYSSDTNRNFLRIVVPLLAYS
jgi:hypothetical protein